MEGNEHGQLKKDTIYAELCHADGTIALVATLEYVLATIRDRNLNIKDVAVEYLSKRGANCSCVFLEL